MGLLYARDGKIYCSDYCEIYIPKEYFESNLASNQGVSVETFGVLFIRSFINGSAGNIQLFNVPVVINLMTYDFTEESITVKGSIIDVMTLKYIKDSYIMRQSITKGREVAESFLAAELGGKLPKSINYANLIDMWWRNLEMSGVNFKVPSKIYELIIATTYRNAHNKKQRYGQLYGKQSNPTGLDYATSPVREVVKDLSTFSGMVFEDMGLMLSNGINNSAKGEVEPVSPLEKIIRY